MNFQIELKNVNLLNSIFKHRFTNKSSNNEIIIPIIITSELTRPLKISHNKKYTIYKITPSRLIFTKKFYHTYLNLKS